MRDRTVLVIPHRLATVRPAHQLLVLDRGRVVERGTHDELLQDGGLYVNGAIVLTSDRNAKEGFAGVDAQEVLAKVVALPLQSWSYTNRPGVKHVGPMAQDFHAAFGLGPDDKHITTVDADGVALAAIQGLNQKVEAGSRETEARNRGLEAENAELRLRLTQLEQRVMRSWRITTKPRDNHSNS